MMMMFGVHATVAAWIIYSKQFYTTVCYSTNVP